MAWLAVDKTGDETIFERKPIMNHYGLWLPNTTCDDYEDSDWIILPQGSIKKLIGRDLTWEDEPVQI